MKMILPTRSLWRSGVVFWNDMAWYLPYVMNKRIKLNRRNSCFPWVYKSIIFVVYGYILCVVSYRPSGFYWMKYACCRHRLCQPGCPWCYVRSKFAMEVGYDFDDTWRHVWGFKLFISYSEFSVQTKLMPWLLMTHILPLPGHEHMPPPS